MLDTELKLNKERIAALRDHFGQRCLRVVASGEIHAYSRMPNSDTIGWWLVAHTAKEACKRVFGKGWTK